jgi:hypothetical protein
MTKKTLKRILDALAAQLGKSQKFSQGGGQWVALKMRPTQFNSSKNFPGMPREFWASVQKNEALLESIPDEPAPTA